MTANAAGQAVRGWAIQGPEGQIRIRTSSRTDVDAWHHFDVYLREQAELLGYRAIEVEIRPISSPAQEAGLRVEHDFRMTLEEVTRIRNTGCGNDWPKVWSRQLDELCDAYRELRRLANAEQP